MDNKNFLFLTDFSDNAAHAFDVLLKMASGINAEIDVLHVVKPDIEAADTPLMSGRMTIRKKEVAEEVLKTFVNTAMQMVPEAHMDINTFVEIGPVISAVNRQLEKKNYSLVVLGTRGENKTKLEKWLGTTSTKIINSVNCNVLLIPAYFQFESISQIAFASSLRDSDPFLFWGVLQLLHPYQPIVRWLHFMEDKLREEERIESFLEYFNDKPGPTRISFHRIKGSDFTSQVERFVEKYHVEMLVMVKRQGSFFEKLFHQSHTIKMANELDVPLFVLKEN